MIELDLQLCRGDFTLQVKTLIEARALGVFGPSGSGKTSLLHLIAGLLKPDQGRVVIDGQVLLDTTRRLHLPPHRRQIGVVFQDARLFPHLSVLGNLRYGLRRCPPHERRVSLDEVVALLELGTLLDRRPSTLSGGEGQRVALGRTLLAGPRLLLFDEPLASLDRPLRQQVLPYFRRVLAQLQVPLLYVSHELGEVLQLTDQLLVLRDGEVQGLGSYHRLAMDPAVLHADDGLCNVVRATLTGHDVVAGNSHLRLDHTGESSAVLCVPLQALAPGMQVHARLRPEDVALALAPVDGISIQNQLPGRVRALNPRAGQVLLDVDVGVPLLVQVSQHTVDRLGLCEGVQVWCLVKSNAVQVLPDMTVPLLDQRAGVASSS
ncbi:MAG: molybdenum ABC transporter ATP-binding protein [Pseudomonadota bacterium]